jgi:hypothetical protein
MLKKKNSKILKESGTMDGWMDCIIITSS